jgi:hypothetical protein
MGRVGYDSLEGILRVSEAGDKQPSQFSVDVLTYHAALEIEMDHLLSLSLPRGDKLRPGRLGFQHKIAVISAAWQGDWESGDRLTEALLRFNDLRNSVAHNDPPRAIERHFRNLVAATAKIHAGELGEASPRDLAIMISAFMGDDPGGRQALEAMAALDEFVNVKLPDLFGENKNSE